MLNNEEKQLLKILTFVYLGSALASVFLQIFFFQKAGFKNLLLFQLMTYISLLLSYVGSSYSLTKFSTRTLMKMGLLVNVVFYLSIIIFPNIIYKIIPLGLFYGLSAGFFWNGFNTSQYLLTNKKERHNYFGKSLSVTNLALTLGPLLGGGIIFLINLIGKSVNLGYYVLFLVVMIVNAVAFILASRLPRHSHLKFSSLALLTIPEKSWSLILGEQFILGLADMAFNTVSAVLYFLVLQKELLLGAANTVGSLIAVLVGFYAFWLLKRFHNLYLIAGFIASLGILLLATNINYFGVISVVLLTSLGISIINVILSADLYQGIDDLKIIKTNVYPYLVQRDFILGLARIISYLYLFLFVTQKDQVNFAKQWVLFIAFYPIILSLFIGVWQKTKQVKLNLPIIN